MTHIPIGLNILLYSYKVLIQKMTNRCSECKKKLGVMEYKCKCGKILCISHLRTEEHNCTHDYKAEGKEQLKKQIDVGKLGTKLEKI